MEQYFQVAAAILVATVLGMTLGKQGKDIGVLLIIAVCCMAVTLAIQYLDPVVELLRDLERTANIQGGMLKILLKAVGIGLVSEIAGMICSDAGSGSFAKVLQILGSAVILWLSVPVFRALMQLIGQIMGEL